MNYKSILLLLLSLNCEIYTASLLNSRKHASGDWDIYGTWVFTIYMYMFIFTSAYYFHIHRLRISNNYLVYLCAITIIAIIIVFMQVTLHYFIFGEVSCVNCTEILWELKYIYLSIGLVSIACSAIIMYRSYVQYKLYARYVAFRDQVDRGDIMPNAINILNNGNPQNSNIQLA